MNRRIHQSRWLGMAMFIFCLLLGWGSVAGAQDATVQCQETQERKIWTEPITRMEFVWIEGGCFQMGQAAAEKTELLKEVSAEDYKNWFERELPQHRVCVDGFWMGKYEVTNAQYRKFEADHDSGEYEKHSLNGDNQPVVMVRWEEAQAFMKWLTEQNKKNPPLPLPGGEFRLPTEAEWEYAARAGTTTARFWGDNPDDACQYANVHDETSQAAFEWDWKPHNCNDKYAVAAPVGQFRPNKFGLYDMLGNVWEWCADWYGPYSKEAVNNPKGPDSGQSRLLRGGSWSDLPPSVRCASRNDQAIDHRYDLLGLRVVVARVRTP